MPKETNEQSKIAEILSTLDRAIEQTEALIAKQQRIKTGLMQDLLTRGIDEQGKVRADSGDGFLDGPFGTMPREWTINSLSNLASVQRGKFSHRPRNDPAFYGGDFPFIQTNDVANNTGQTLTTYEQTLNKRGVSVSKEFPVGTIAVTIAANIADTAILGTAMYFPDSLVGVCAIVPNNARFLEMALRRWKPILDQLAPQSAQKNINLDTLRPLPIPTPSPSEQDKIASLYESTVQHSNLLVTSLKKLTALKKSLMQDLLGGKRRVTPLLSSAPIQ